MHFTTIFLLKNEKLENISATEIESLFFDRFCYGCGTTKPKYQYYCDWFSIGGRWPDMFKAKKGIHCESKWSNDYFKPQEGQYTIVEIKDLEEPINAECVYSIATKSRIYKRDNEKFFKLIEQINNKEIKGVIAFIDCHD